MSTLTADKLYVITPYSNFERWTTRPRIFSKFIDHMKASGVSLVVVECELGERPFTWDKVPGIIHVGVRAHTTLWHKENLINIGISRLPADWKYVAWIDGDITFRKSSWALDTLHALQRYSIVQPWSDAYDLGPHDEHMQLHKSFAYQYWNKQPVSPTGPNFWSFAGGPYTYPHSGYAWAATRQAIEWLGGLIEICILGAADHHMALGLVGEIDKSMPGGLNQNYIDTLHLWQARALTHVNRNIGFVQGTIEHAFHGRKADRKYVDRWEIITKNDYNPVTDIKKNIWGVSELAGNKPELTLDLLHYASQRNEDINSL